MSIKSLRKYSEKGFDDVFIFAPNEEMVTYGVKMLAFDGCCSSQDLPIKIFIQS